MKEQLTFTGEDTAMATLLLSVMGAFAEFERSLIRERQREGIALARQRGAYRGRTPALNIEQVAQLRQRVADGIPKATTLAREFGVSRETVYQLPALDPRGRADRLTAVTIELGPLPERAAEAFLSPEQQRPYHGGCVDADPLPARDPRRPAGTVDQRRRDPLHGVSSNPELARQHNPDPPPGRVGLMPSERCPAGEGVGVGQTMGWGRGVRC